MIYDSSSQKNGLSHSSYDLGSYRGDLHSSLLTIDFFHELRYLFWISTSINVTRNVVGRSSGMSL